MRTFIGIDFDNELKNNISELIQSIRKYSVRGRWKHVDNFHLTLKFLDEISESQQMQIDTAMKELCSKSKPFSLSIKDIGIFNGRESIRVLWLGLGGDVKELGLLHKQTDETLSTLRFIPEKRSFKPHVTIGQDIVFECGFDQIRDAIGQPHYNSITVSSLFLFKSEQIGNKRVYTKVSQYDLYKKHY